MALGYAAVQGYTGRPANPVAPNEPPSPIFGQISQGLNLASGLFQAWDSFQMASGYRDSYRALKRQALEALEQGYQTGIDIRREGEDILGEMTATFGKSGATLSGSPLLVLQETTDRIEENIDRAIKAGKIRYRALYKEARKMKKAESRAKIAGIGKIAGSVAAFAISG